MKKKVYTVLHKKTIPLAIFTRNITTKQRQNIDEEKMYYHIVIGLKNMREKLGLTQDDLAQQAKLPRTTITKIESGTRNVTVQTLMLIAQAMGKRVELRLI